MLHRRLCVGLVLLNVAIMPPQQEPFDLDVFNAQTARAVGYGLYEYWHLFTAPDGPALLERRMESLWWNMHGDDPERFRRFWCEPSRLRQYLEEDRKGDGRTVDQFSRQFGRRGDL